MSLNDDFSQKFRTDNNLPEWREETPESKKFIDDITPFYIAGIKSAYDIITKKHSENKRCFVVIYIITKGVKTKVYEKKDVPGLDKNIKNETFLKYIDVYDLRYMIPICVKHKAGIYRSLVSQPWVSVAEINEYKKQSLESK